MSIMKEKRLFMNYRGTSACKIYADTRASNVYVGGTYYESGVNPSVQSHRFDASLAFQLLPLVDLQSVDSS